MRQCTDVEASTAALHGSGQFDRTVYKVGWLLASPISHGEAREAAWPLRASAPHTC